MISIQRTTVFFPWEWRTAFGFSVAHAGTRVWASCLILVGDHCWYDLAWTGSIGMESRCFSIVCLPVFLHSPLTFGPTCSLAQVRK
jgi:hypothetical protein